VAGKSVLELGAGIGDLSHYYLDRGCRMTITEVRKSNLRYLKRRYPQANIHMLDLESPYALDGAPFDIVHCFGLLYHLSDPGSALEFIGSVCKELLILATCVSLGDEVEVNPVYEMKVNPSQSYSGLGCRPTRAWINHELRKHFEYVYVPLTQPNHEQFPIDWTVPAHEAKLSRAIFLASRIPIENDKLSTKLISHQVWHI